MLRMFSSHVCHGASLSRSQALQDNCMHCGSNSKRSRERCGWTVIFSNVCLSSTEAVSLASHKGAAAALPSDEVSL